METTITNTIVNPEAVKTLTEMATEQVIFIPEDPDEDSSTSGETAFIGDDEAMDFGSSES